MVKTKIKRAVSFVMATVLSLSAFMSIGTSTAFAASGEKTKVYMVDFPRDGDANYDGVWGHSNLTLKNGWHTGSSTHTNLKAIGSYSGNIAYCIEPGVSLSSGQSMNKYDENYFNNITANGVISGDEIRLFIGRILQYGYRGTISTSWRLQNESAANSIAHAYATQLLIWETVVGERDANFNHKAASGCSNVKDVINAKHPLRSKIMSYYNSMVSSVQNHTVVPSFCTKSSGSAKVNELEWNGSKYVATLTDSNGVLSNYDFKANISGVAFSTSGNKLTVSMDKAPSKEFTITASKKNGVRRGVVVWSEGKHGQNSSVQDVVTYAQEVSDPVTGYVKMKVSYGSCQIVKTSEDGKVDGINFTISGNGVNQTVTTANGGKFQIDNLMPGVYTVTEQSIDKYVPQEVHRVTVVAGQVATVNFNNVLKRGNLQVIKSSEDNLVEGVKFHLYGTSLAGIAVDEYAVTDKNGVATFKDVLISGSTPYTLEEVDTAIRYVVPEKQTAPIQWKEVTNRDFTNILKKFSVTVTKSDREEGTAQGDAKLSGAVYGIYKGDTLDELRYKEEQIAKDKSDGIKAEARYTTVNDIYELWKDLKRGLKNNTFENYKYMYETFVRHQIGSKTVSSLRKTDIKRFYNYLADERHLKPATIDNIHTVLHQILDMAVDDDYIRNNPSNNVLKELKQSHCFQTEKRRALTKPEQELFLDYLKNSPTSKYWYPVFAVMIGTGLRVGEVTGLRWCDIDLEEGIIDVNHTLVYYDHRTEGSKRGCYFNVNTTKTPAGRRKVPMLGFVKEAFLMEKERQELLDLHCEATVDGYTDFIFINRFGQPQHQATLNKAIRRIIRDCNDEQLLKDENAEVLLPHFSCHSLRHTFTTRMCEAGVNVKVIQDTLGHKDISTTLNIYTDVTKELRKSEFEGLDSYFKNEYNKVSV